MQTSYEVKDKSILVTGANRGIGKAIVESFLENGARKVYAAVRSLTSVGPLTDTYGERVVPMHVDLADARSIIEAAKTAHDVQIVVNNAGVLQVATPLEDNAIASLEFQMNVNVYGLIRMAQAFAPVLKNNGGGAFVQLNSIASLKCFSAFTTYSTSKAAAYSVTQGLREVLAVQGTRVVSVHPGPIATDMLQSAGLGDVPAEPPRVVADSIVTALQSGDFHVFPDSMAREIGAAYRSFAEAVVEANIMDGE